jgi:hypothetical protein
MNRESTLEKYVAESYVLLRSDKNYTAVHPLTLTDMALVTEMSRGTTQSSYEKRFSFEALEEYLGYRKIPNVHNINLIDWNKSRFFGTAGTLYVRSLDPKDWKKEKYYELIVANLVPKNSPVEKIGESLRNLNADCECPIHKKLMTYTVLPHQMRMFDDNRKPSDVPAPLVRTICKHGILGLNELSSKHGTADFGVFGPTQHVIEATFPLIDEILEMKHVGIPPYILGRMPSRMFSRMVRKHRRKILSYLNDLYWRGYISPA